VDLQEFNPERVDVFHDRQGHQGTALITFKKDIYGLDAEAFEKSFAAVGRGHKQWHSDKQLQLHQYCCNEKLQEFHAAGSFNLYGWQATEQVYSWYLILYHSIQSISFVNSRKLINEFIMIFPRSSNTLAP
jgi:hypothetical protein